MYTARAIANYYLKKCRQEKVDLDALKLQKLIYFSHGWHLAIRDRALINERVEAWQYGPVFPSVYHEFKRFGRGPIDSLAIDQDEGETCWAPAVPENDEKTRRILNRVWEVYGKLEGTRLSRMTHHRAGPWAAIWRTEAQNGKIKGVDIPEASIQEYFRQAAQKKVDGASA